MLTFESLTVNYVEYVRSVDQICGVNYVLATASWLLWPALAAVPLVLTYNDAYKHVFPASWYDTARRDFWYHADGLWPSPLGLSLGLLAVVVGQIFTLIYFCVKRRFCLGHNEAAVQKQGAVQYVLDEGIMTHLSQPEGFVLLGGYLIFSWMLGLMPASYYSHSGGINWLHVAQQLLLQDFFMYVMHQGEHYFAELYKVSHKPHHRWTNPRLFDAFNGSLVDTFLMILVPLVLTARCVDANVWSYMAFGSIYANWLTLIHSEYVHVWDPVFALVGFGTPWDHHVHHKLFVYNYGHIFTYWDKLFGTYKSPSSVDAFNCYDKKLT
jgi:sterol desaturase/sphingolipid hydroxylase (fatty acid hydroxylase superfamily)